jgi:hypothetical protein
MTKMAELAFELAEALERGGQSENWNKHTSAKHVAEPESDK